MSPARRARRWAAAAAAPPDDETMDIRAHICFAAHGIKNCGETDPEWCRCYRYPGHHGEHRCACGHRWDPQPCRGCEIREAGR